MKIFFAGTPEFAVPTLIKIERRFPIVGVLTQADARQGRGQKLFPSPVKQTALSLSVPVFEPDTLDAAFIETVKDAGAELLVCVAFGKIFKRSFLDAFPAGGINIHPSLLPRYRGPAPIPAAILAGDAETGVTVQRLALKMDTGDVLAQRPHPIAPTDNAAALSAALSELGADLCVSVIEDLAAGRARATPQDEAAATYCPLLSKEAGLVDFRADAPSLSRRIRAYTPWPLAYAFWKKKRIFFLEGGTIESRPPPHPAAPGTVLGMDKDHGILIHTGNGILFVKTIQLEHKSPLYFRDFLNGHRDFIGSLLTGGGGRGT